MAFLVTFYWGWLLASVLLGLAMGWIAVVHRGPGVSKLRRRASGRMADDPAGAATSVLMAGMVGCRTGSALALAQISARLSYDSATRRHPGARAAAGPSGTSKGAGPACDEG